jgi:hypothetical protein
LGHGQEAGRGAQQKTKIYLYFFDLWPNFACCYASSFNHLSIPSRLPFFLLMQGENAQEPNSRVAFVRAALPHPGCFMVDLDPAKRSKATMTTPSSNK